MSLLCDCKLYTVATHESITSLHLHLSKSISGCCAKRTGWHCTAISFVTGAHRHSSILGDVSTKVTNPFAETCRSFRWDTPHYQLYRMASVAHGLSSSIPVWVLRLLKRIPLGVSSLLHLSWFVCLANSSDRKGTLVLTIASTCWMMHVHRL